MPAVPALGVALFQQLHEHAQPEFHLGFVTRIGLAAAECFRKTDFAGEFSV
jgi:hypothetical protein